MITVKTRKRLAIALGLIGFYVIIDGIGSILVYLQQPLFFDHLMRLIRTLVGTLIVYVGVRLRYD